LFYGKRNDGNFLRGNTGGGRGLPHIYVKEMNMETVRVGHCHWRAGGWGYWNRKEHRGLPMGARGDLEVEGVPQLWECHWPVLGSTWSSQASERQSEREGGGIITTPGTQNL